MLTDHQNQRYKERLEAKNGILVKPLYVITSMNIFFFFLSFCEEVEDIDKNISFFLFFIFFYSLIQINSLDFTAKNEIFTSCSLVTKAGITKLCPSRKKHGKEETFSSQRKRSQVWKTISGVVRGLDLKRPFIILVVNIEL